MSEPTHAWCPSCKEESAINWERRCLWCDGETEQRRKRGGGKPKGVYGKLSDNHLKALHRFHVDQGISIRELGRRIWERAGYASAGSAAEGISAGFRRLGLSALPQPVATALANERRRADGSPGTADRAAYKRWLRERAGGYRRCAAIKSQAPGKGRRCAAYAQADSDYCFVHDPANRAEVEANVTAMRERIGAAA